jgi:hypothetical protein
MKVKILVKSLSFSIILRPTSYVGSISNMYSKPQRTSFEFLYFLQLKPSNAICTPSLMTLLRYYHFLLLKTLQFNHMILWNISDPTVDILQIFSNIDIKSTFSTI